MNNIPWQKPSISNVVIEGLTASGVSPTLSPLTMPESWITGKKVAENIGALTADGYPAFETPEIDTGATTEGK